MNVDLWVSVGCRCGGAGVMRHLGAAVRTAAPWHTPNLVYVRTHSANVVVLQLRRWDIQPRDVQSSHYSRTLPILHLPLLQSIRKRWLDFSWGCSPLYHRWTIYLDSFVWSFPLLATNIFTVFSTQITFATSLTWFRFYPPWQVRRQCTPTWVIFQKGL